MLTPIEEHVFPCFTRLPLQGHTLLLLLVGTPAKVQTRGRLYTCAVRANTLDLDARLR